MDPSHGNCLGENTGTERGLKPTFRYDVDVVTKKLLQVRHETAQIYETSSQFHFDKKVDIAFWPRIAASNGSKHTLGSPSEFLYSCGYYLLLRLPPVTFPCRQFTMQVRCCIGKLLVKTFLDHFSRLLSEIPTIHWEDFVRFST